MIGPAVGLNLDRMCVLIIATVDRQPSGAAVGARARFSDCELPSAFSRLVHCWCPVGCIINLNYRPGALTAAPKE
jgi:hypothetical protein